MQNPGGVTDRLIAPVGRTNVILPVDDQEPYTVDWRGRYRGDALAVVRPGSTQEVAEVVRLLVAAGVAILPQGGNTGLCGAAIPSGGRPSVIVRLDRMRRIRAVSPLANTITVEAGCVLADIQAAAEAADRLFPLSLGAEGSCRIGGNIGTNAGGTAVLRYGPTRELVLGIEAVLPDGRVPGDLAALSLLALSYSGLAFAGANIWTLPGDVAPTPAHVASISGIQNFASNLAGIALTAFTGVMVSITKGSFVIPLAVAGCLGLVGAASYLFIVGEIAPLKAKGDDDEGGARAPALATGRA